MNYLSVCSGIEAATVGWHSLGWKPVAFSEIEKFPCSALAHHYPDVPNWGDMTKFKEWPDANVNVLVGGTPCQSFSVAGLRKGLADPRGNLMLTYLAIAAKYSPEWLVWENVPGVLSSNGGRDFASLLRGMGQLGYGFAYRILDAQYFGVPQRRRRVFVVGHLGSWQRAAAVLFERHSLQGHPAPSREAGKGFTHPVAPSLTSSGRGVERGGDTRGQDPVVAVEAHRMVAFGEYVSDDTASAMKMRDYKDATDLVTQPFSIMPMNSGKDYKARPTDVAQPIMASGQTHGNQGGDVIVTHSLRGEGFDASEAGRGTPLVPIAWSEELTASIDVAGTIQRGGAGGRHDGVAIPVAYFMITANTGANGLGVAAEVAPTLDQAQPCAVAFAHQAGGAQTTLSYDQGRGTAPTLSKCQTPAVAIDCYNGAIDGDVSASIRVGNGNAMGGVPATMAAMQVRRLLPVECEKLQGFLPGYTDVPYRGKPAADGPRYKALGNSMAVPVMAWIGKRIQQVEEITCTTKQKYRSQ